MTPRGGARPAHIRLLARRVIDPETGCWRGAGTDAWRGYRRIQTGSRTDGTYRAEYVHVVAYKAWIGPIPEGYEVDHVAARGCRYRDCS